MEIPAQGPSNRAYEPHTPRQRLGYLIEECGEVLAAAGKTLRWGYESSNPELPPEQRETNRDWLRRELGNLKAAIERIEPDLVDDRAEVAEPGPVYDVNPRVIRCPDCNDQVLRARERRTGRTDLLETGMVPVMLHSESTAAVPQMARTHHRCATTVPHRVGTSNAPEPK